MCVEPCEPDPALFGRAMQSVDQSKPFPDVLSGPTAEEVGRLHAAPGVAPKRDPHFAAVTSDAELALTLQLAEMERAKTEEPMHIRLPPKWVLADPVWGEVKYLADPTKCQKLAFACLPCLVVGCRGQPMLCCGQHQEAVPSRDARRSWRRCFLSFSVIISVAQIAVFACVVPLGGGFVDSGMNPMLGPHPHIFDPVGAKNAARILELNEWWRLLSPMMLHSGVFHLAANMLVQLRFGLLLEVLWGHSLWLAVYLVSGVYSSLASCIFLPDAISVGSSGGICGLVGADIVFILLTWRQTLPRDILDRNLQLVSLAGTAVMTGALSFLPMVDFAAHGGGFVAGGLVALVVFSDRLQDWSQLSRHMVQDIGIALLLVLFVASLVFFILEVEPDSDLLDLCQPPEC